MLNEVDERIDYSSIIFSRAMFLVGFSLFGWGAGQVQIDNKITISLNRVSLYGRFD